MSNNKTCMNILFSIITLIVSVIQSIWFVPFIIRELGSEVYGYVAVVVSFINIVMVMSIAITSMSSRYITIEMQKKNINEANKYFNSILFALLFISIIIIIVLGLVTYNVNFIMNVAIDYKEDVQILYILSGISLVISIINTPFLAGLYFKNKLYIMYIISNLVYIGKMIIPLISWKLGNIHIWDMALGGLVVDIASLIFYLIKYKDYMPGIKINIMYCDLSYIKNIIESGVWVSISKAGNLLLSSVSTYLSNILIDPAITGIYATILQLQSLIVVMSNSLINCFVPKMYKIYADNDREKLIYYTKKALTILSIPLGIICGEVVVFGRFFMTFWIGNSFIEYGMLIFLIIISMPFYVPAEIFNQINITINKIKVPAIVTIVFGVFNILFIIILCKIFNWGIYGVVLSQLIVNSIRGFVFFPIYTSKKIKLPSRTFIKEIILAPTIALITIFISIVCNMLIDMSIWNNFIIGVILTTICISIGIFLCVLKSNDKKILLNFISVKVKSLKRGKYR